MSLERFEVGIVSADRALVDLLADVFELEELAASEYPLGTLHRLQAPGAVIKVMVPSERPRHASPVRGHGTRRGRARRSIAVRAHGTLRDSGVPATTVSISCDD